ncbi:MAG: Gfo/Idh/MocA family oxidoreductase [Roseburia sp.]|nr:Gfo/Idh/MocA family oxidoreductase [Roseburia sp.]MCM1201658.1 Gfo/Idh/MocA family oxidoreductase [Bacteroides fragilis]
MKICMIGLGSIGKRHLKNLTIVLGKRGIKYQIDALRCGNTALDERWVGILSKQYYRIDEMPDDYDIIFVTNPTLLHYDTIKNVIAKTKHMFIEKPVFASADYNIEELAWKKGSIYYVACPLRHKSIMKFIKQNIKNYGNIISVRVISTSYLPAWRKGVDYRNIYSARRDLGGGVTKDLIHEWDYVMYLFGKPDKVVNMRGHVSALEIDSDDISIYIARYPNMFLEMHLDYVGHKTERILQMFTNNKRIDVDLVSDIVYEYENDELTNKQEFPEEDCYINELEYFLDCIEKKQENMNTVSDAYDTLKTALMED